MSEPVVAQRVESTPESSSGGLNSNSQTAGPGGPLLTQKSLQRGPLGLAGFLIGLFTDFTRRRDPPHSDKTRHLRLITIRLSHFCEKGRWVLDLVEADRASPFYYTEDPHPPVFHAFQVLEASKGNGSSTPCVVLDPDPSGDEGGMNPDVEFISGSGNLQRRFLPNAYPRDIEEKVTELEDFLDKVLGPAVRGFAYYYLLQDHDSIIASGGTDTTVIERLLFSVLFSVGIAPALMKSLNVSEESASLDRKSVLDIFTLVSNRLRSNGGQYIMDSPTSQFGFTAVDLTFAALTNPLLQPPELLAAFPPPREIPTEISMFSEELKGTIAGQHGLRMYKMHRLQGGKDSVMIKGVVRNRSLWPFP